MTKMFHTEEALVAPTMNFARPDAGLDHVNGAGCFPAYDVQETKPVALYHGAANAVALNGETALVAPTMNFDKPRTTPAKREERATYGETPLVAPKLFG